MTGNLSDLPRGQFAENILGQALAFFLQARDLFGYIDGGLALLITQRFNLALELGNRLFKIEKRGFHRIYTGRTARKDGRTRPPQVRAF